MLIEAEVLALAREAADLDAEAVTVDCISSVRIVQRRRGYRFNLDPILLAQFAAEEGVRAPAIDLGTGSGLIALLLAKRYGVRSVAGLELQRSLFELAQKNARLNGVEGGVSMILGDLRQAAASFRAGAFSHVISNPPYRSARDGLVSPDEERAIARHELRCNIADVAKAAAWLLGDDGAASVIFPSSRFEQLCDALSSQGLKPAVVRFVHPRPERAAKLVLLRAVKGEGPPLTVRPPLFLHESEGQAYSAEVLATLS